MNPRALLRASLRRYAETLRLDVRTTVGPGPASKSASQTAKPSMSGQCDVYEDERRRERPRERERGLPVCCLPDDLEALGLEQRARERPEAGVVVDYEDGRRHGWKGRTPSVGPHQGQPYDTEFR